MDFCSRDYHHYSLSSTTKWELHKRHNRSRYLHGVCYNTSLSTFSGVRCARWWSATASFALQWYTCTTHTHTHRYFCAKRAIAGNQPSSPFHHTMLWHTGQGDGPPGGLTGWWCCSHHWNVLSTWSSHWVVGFTLNYTPIRVDPQPKVVPDYASCIPLLYNKDTTTNQNLRARNATSSHCRVSCVWSTAHAR